MVSDATTNGSVAAKRSSTEPSRPRPRTVVIRKTGSPTALCGLIGNTLKGVTIEELYEPDFLFILYFVQLAITPT
jgi:hypothetical protein